METGAVASALGSTGGLGTQISITLFFPTLKSSQRSVTEEDVTPKRFTLFPIRVVEPKKFFFFPDPDPAVTC
jgi:hypothetical protein